MWCQRWVQVSTIGKCCELPRCYVYRTTVNVIMLIQYLSILQSCSQGMTYREKYGNS